MDTTTNNIVKVVSLGELGVTSVANIYTGYLHLHPPADSLKYIEIDNVWARLLENPRLKLQLSDSGWEVVESGVLVCRVKYVHDFQNISDALLHASSNCL